MASIEKISKKIVETESKKKSLEKDWYSEIISGDLHRVKQLGNKLKLLTNRLKYWLRKRSEFFRH